MFPLLLPAAVAVYIARNEIVPKDLPGRIAFFDRKAALDLAAYKRANALRLRRLAARHLKRYRTFRDEAARLRAYQSRIRPAVLRPVSPRARPRYAPPPPAFRPAIQRPPPMPSAAPVFQPYGPPSSGEQVEESPPAMDPSSAREAMEATAAAPGAEAGAESGIPWGKIGLVALGGFVVYKVATRKKKGAKASSSAAAA